jgi:hypothetical protein
MPAVNTLPIITSLTASNGKPAASIAALMAIEPNCGAVNVEREPKNAPIGVLLADIINVEDIVSILYSNEC